MRDIDRTGRDSVPWAYGRVRRNSRSGMTIVEVLVAGLLSGLLCAGLFAVGLSARKFAEHNRLSAEARSLAKERLEEMVSVGLDNLRQPSCLLRFPATNTATLGYAIERNPRLVWHGADGNIAAAEEAVYAEAHVDVTYYSPLLKKSTTDTYSTLIQ